jgi:hypothetical protein
MAAKKNWYCTWALVLLIQSWQENYTERPKASVKIHHMHVASIAIYAMHQKHHTLPGDVQLVQQCWWQPSCNRWCCSVLATSDVQAEISQILLEVQSLP